MSKINDGLYSSQDMTWQTPPHIVQALLRFEGLEEFYLDPCCSTKNIPAKFHYQHPHMDGLALKWAGLVFMNPPYGDALKLFMEKAFNESQTGVKIWALIPARTETLYQHNFGLTKAGFTVFLKGRLEFWKDGEPHLVWDKKAEKWKPGVAPFPTMLCYYGDDWKEKARRWLENPPLEGTLMVQGHRLNLEDIGP